MKCRFSALLAMTMLMSAALAAHHSFAGTYIEGALTKIEGKVVEFNVRNPHSFIVIEVEEKDGKKVKWGGEWGSVTQLSQGGAERFSLEGGDYLIIEGAPPRDSSGKKVLVSKVSRPATDTRPAWEWSGQVR